VEVLKTLNEENIPTVVWLCPILPFINDNEDNINQIIDYCIDTNVKGIICFGMGLTLREGNREYAADKRHTCQRGVVYFLQREQFPCRVVA
jgi:DNA repair photolyase